MKAKKNVTIIMTVLLIFSLMFFCACDFSRLLGNSDEEDEPYESVLIFEENTDGTYTVRGRNRQDTSIVIPETYRGKPVTGIGDEAFFGYDGLVEVILSKNITSIGEYAFAYCSALETIDLVNVETLEDWAFFVSGLKYITIPESVTYIGNGAFTACDYLEEINFNASSLDYTEGGIFAAAGEEGNGIVVNFGDNITKIPDRLFYVYGVRPKITHVYMGNSVEIIGEGAFSTCSELAYIVISENVKEIGAEAFSSCYDLMYVEYNAKNIETVGEDLFLNAGLRGGMVINFSQSVEEIPADLLYVERGNLVPKVNYVIIGSNVVSIGARALYRYQDAYYMGSAEEWEEITVGESNGFSSSSFPFFYSETEPIEDENLNYSYWHYDAENRTPVLW